ncbi:MAG: transcriptional repressor LexA [bacterium]
MPRVMNVESHVANLRKFWRQERRLPGYGEMLELFGYQSKHAVFRALRKLEELGFLERKKGRAVATGKLTGTLRLLGAVQAGFPSPAEEELADTMSLDELLIRRPEATFMLTVQGDSMIAAGIIPGDMVLVEKGGTPKPNDIVVAQVDDEWTLKYYMKDREGVRLDPANSKYKSIRPKRSLVIGGIVKAVIRKYA